MDDGIEGHKLSTIGLKTLAEAKTLGIRLAGIGVYMSGPPSLPSLAGFSRQALEGLMHMGAEAENAVQYVKSSKIGRAHV